MVKSFRCASHAVAFARALSGSVIIRLALGPRAFAPDDEITKCAGYSGSCERASLVSCALFSGMRARTRASVNRNECNTCREGFIEIQCRVPISSCSHQLGMSFCCSDEGEIDMVSNLCCFRGSFVGFDGRLVGRIRWYWSCAATCEVILGIRWIDILKLPRFPCQTLPLVQLTTEQS